MNSISVALPLSNKPHMAQTKHGAFENKWMETALICSGTVLCGWPLRFSSPQMQSGHPRDPVCSARGEGSPAPCGTESTRDWRCSQGTTPVPAPPPPQCFWGHFLTFPTAEPLGKVAECLSWRPMGASVTSTRTISPRAVMHSTIMCGQDKPP